MELMLAAKIVSDEEEEEEEENCKSAFLFLPAK